MGQLTGYCRFRQLFLFKRTEKKLQQLKTNELHDK